MKKVDWPIRKALLILGSSIGATLLVGLAAIGLRSHWKHQKRSDSRYNIAAIAQTGPEKEALKSVYLAELLGLSVDAPKNLYALDLHEAAKALLISPLIKTAEVKRIEPSTLYVDYEARKPIAWLADYRNIGIDSEGYIFPVAPFFSPQEMPEIYIGCPAFEKEADLFGREGGRWRVPLKNRFLDLAFALLRLFEEAPWKEGLRLKRIDVSNAFAPTLGRREIVLFTEEELIRGGTSFAFPKILRLGTQEYAQQIQNFFALRGSMIEDYRKQLSETDKSRVVFQEVIVDLRVPQLAFVGSAGSDLNK